MRTAIFMQHSRYRCAKGSSKVVNSCSRSSGTNHYSSAVTFVQYTAVRSASEKSIYLASKIKRKTKYTTKRYAATNQNLRRSSFDLGHQKTVAMNPRRLCGKTTST